MSGLPSRSPSSAGITATAIKRMSIFYRAIPKYGWENIEHEIVENGLTKQQARDLEIELIAKYDATDQRNGYDNGIGGECGSLGVHPSAETRLKISESPNRAYLNPELRQKLSEARKGKRPGDECIMKSVEAHRGKPLSDETRRKIGMKLKGKPLSDETRKKMSEARKGKKASEHVILAMTEATGKKALCVETGEVHKSTSEAGRQLGISSKAISNVCRGKTKTSGGYHWEYAEEPR